MKKEIREWNRIMTVGLLLAVYITFLLVFVTAYLNPAKRVIVDINSVGEANIEMFILILITICVIIMYIYEAKTFLNQRE